MRLVKLRKPATSARRITAIAGSVALLAGTGTAAVAGAAGAAPAATAASAASAAKAEMSDISSSCHLGNGVTHVVKIMFDNVHFFRDNPNVPSDLELMPNLLNFFKDNGTILSNNHTPLIAHTANDILSTYTGLYGDRHGDPIANSYRAYNATGRAGRSTPRTRRATSPTGPPRSSTRRARRTRRTTPTRTWCTRRCRRPPRTLRCTPDTTTPAPWVPYTRAGCDWGAVATANVELENTGVDIPTVFGAELAGGGRSSTPTDTLQATRRPRTMSASRCIAPRAARSARTPPPTKFGQTTAHPVRLAGPAARRAARLHRLPGTVRPQVRGDQLERGQPAESARTTATR